MAPRGTYRTIADELRRLIERGELAPGEMVPSELALSEQHQVARGTVRSALALLVDEGLIEVVAGQGRRVVGAAAPVPTTAYERIAADLLRRTGWLRPAFPATPSDGPINVWSRREQ